MSFQSRVYGFIPTSITGCQVWLDGADPAGNGVVPANNATVSTWADKSGNGKNGTGGVSPTYNTSEKAITFNGSSWLSTSYSSVPANETAFIVFKTTSTAVQNNCFMIGPSSSGGRLILSVNENDGFGLSFKIGAYGIANGSRLSQVQNQMYLGTTTVASTTSFVYLNGTQGSSSTLTYSGSSTTQIGTAVSGSAIYIGYIYEIIMYNSLLGTTERQQVEAYLAQKWGLRSSLPLGHPGLGETIYRADYTKQNAMTARPFYTAFSPTQIPGCALWLDAADSSTITGTSPVTQWRDKSVNNYSMTYTGSPTYRNTAALKLGCITFNGTTSFNSGTDTMYWSTFSLSQPFTVFTVCTKRLSSNSSYSFVLEPSISSGSVILYSVLQLVIYAGSANQYTNPIISFVANSTQIYSAVFNGASSILAFAGSATSSLNPGTASWPGLYLGRDWGGTYDSGDYGEIIFYSGALSTTQRQQVESYLAQKWDLTTSLPGDHLNETQPAGAITLQSLANKRIVRKRPLYTINWTYASIPSVGNLILQVNSRNWTSSSSILDSITGVAWNLTNASLNSSRNTILMAGNGLFKYNNAGAGPAGFSGTQHTVMMVYYRLADATGASKGNPPSLTLNLTGYLYTINRTPASITNQLLAGENSSWVYQSAYQVGTNQTVLNGTTGWTFIAFVYTGTALNVYLNGQPENNTNGVSNPATTTLTNNYFSIFGNPRDNNSFINGELAFYGLWNTQLSAQNILDFYNANKDQFLAFP
jgi:hypothetical protein